MLNYWRRVLLPLRARNLSSAMDIYNWYGRTMALSTFTRILIAFLCRLRTRREIIRYHIRIHQSACLNENQRRCILYLLYLLVDSFSWSIMVASTSIMHRWVQSFCAANISVCLISVCEWLIRWCFLYCTLNYEDFEILLLHTRRLRKSMVLNWLYLLIHWTICCEAIHGRLLLFLSICILLLTFTGQFRNDYEFALLILYALWVSFLPKLSAFTFWWVSLNHQEVSGDFRPFGIQSLLSILNFDEFILFADDISLLLSRLELSVLLVYQGLLLQILKFIHSWNIGNMSWNGRTLSHSAPFVLPILSFYLDLYVLLIWLQSIFLHFMLI